MIKGQKDYEKFQQGIKLSPIRAIRAQCYICNGEGGGGVDCMGTSCPLYPYLSSRKGKIKKPKLILTKSEKQIIRNRFLKGKKKKGVGITSTMF